MKFQQLDMFELSHLLDISPTKRISLFEVWGRFAITKFESSHPGSVVCWYAWYASDIVSNLKPVTGKSVNCMHGRGYTCGIPHAFQFSFEFEKHPFPP